MRTLFYFCLPLALLLTAAPALFANPLTAPTLEARITAMGKVNSASSAHYSPDGTQIAYITSLSGSPQAWIIPAQGGYPRQVSNGSDPVSGLRWSPDGKLAYAVSPVSLLLEWKSVHRTASSSFRTIEPGLPKPRLGDFVGGAPEEICSAH
ncbi:hypothetical protein CR152_24070 [Massilia violaceinigra]|uniref:Dipeptidylpeptidase IV N-terminal domain-containing protein n=1 Tax=Massilia violaceinigra TaxID=2045208 RepID=A0A2D2DQJ3_9BURK|nr:PD40 domain-containing protein [Massilia violaceinigra]ATQ77251.1 hypothetical protein CR152_24070 [Massilia violaceinigra]